MRDDRFIAAHRGGPLGIEDHRLLALWAADCAEHVLPLFGSDSQDERPLRAVVGARAWAQGSISVGEARAAAFAAHAAAREAPDKAAAAAARACGHAAAAAHMADHSLRAAGYALKACACGGAAVEAEIEWQDRRLPQGVRELVLSARASAL